MSERPWYRDPNLWIPFLVVAVILGIALLALWGALARHLEEEIHPQGMGSTTEEVLSDG